MCLEADKEGSTRNGAAKMVREMDVDGDGLISREEFFAILTEAANPDDLSNYDMRLIPVDEEFTPSASTAGKASVVL